MTQTPHNQRSMRRIAFASMVGTTVEFYDFFIFGTAAALVFSSQFFPALGAAGGTLASLATFGVAFLARPFGSMLFGHYGDRIGRKATLVATLLLMGLATVAIGLLPSAATIGVAAPILLVLFRVLQGVAMGGEWAGAVLLTGEHAPRARRGFYAMFPQMGPAVALALAMGTFLLTSLTMSSEQFLAWGWRIPFLASVVMVVIGLFVRLKIDETPAFVSMSKTKSTVKLPILDVIRYERKQLLLGAGSLAMVFAFFHTGATYLTSYGSSELGLAKPAVLGIGIAGALTFAVFIAVSAMLSDRYGRRRVTIFATFLALPWSLLLFVVIDIGTAAAFAIGVCITLAITGIGYGPAGAQLPELFRARYRYTGAGVAYSLAGVIGGAIPPFVSAALIPVFGSMAVGIYLAGYAALSMVCLIAMRETLDSEMVDKATESAVQPASA